MTLGGSGASLLAGALAVVLAVVLLAGSRRRRTFARRVDAVASSLSGAPLVASGGPLVSLERLEAVADANAVRCGGMEAVAARLSEALRLVGQGVVVCDEAGRVVYRNDLAATFVGARHGEALAAKAVDDVLAAAVAGEATVQSLELYGPPRRTLTISAQPLEGDGARTIGAVAVIDDVSERRRLESVRRDFVANISHELKTPVGALGILADVIGAEDDAGEIRRLSERMSAEAFRVSRIIDDLLDLSRIEAEEVPARQPLAVGAVVAEAAERVGSVAQHRGIELRVDEGPPHLAVLGDRRQLVSALHSLLENALHYSDGGSSVEVRVEACGDAVEISVCDHGVGIPSRELERIFERFYRVDRARSRNTGGTGLGLSIVRHVAANHRGEVRVASQEGVGSTFTLRLPLGPGPLAPPEGAPAPAADDLVPPARRSALR